MRTLLVILCVLILGSLSLGMTLKKVVLVFRHGHRNPMELYPTHPDYGTKGNDFFNQLTEIGEQQAANLGHRLEKFYAKHLNFAFNADNVNARSSLSPRAIMTGKKFMQRFVMADEVTVTPIQKDYVIGLFGKCKKYEELFNDYFYNRTFPLLTKTLAYLTPERIARFEAFSGKHLDSIRSIAGLMDTIISERGAGRELPEWTNEVYDVLYPISSIVFQTILYTPYMLKEKSGPLVKEIKDFLSSDENDNHRFNVYSGHDLTLWALIKAFKVEDQFPVVINYTATIAFELWQLQDGTTHEVKMRFFDLGIPEKEITIPGCNDRTCYKHEFDKITEELVVDDINAFCENPADAALLSEPLGTSDRFDYLPVSMRKLAMDLFN